MTRIATDPVAAGLDRIKNRHAPVELTRKAKHLRFLGNAVAVSANVLVARVPCINALMGVSAVAVVRNVRRFGGMSGFYVPGAAS
jgi:hypothetical protein